MRVFITCLIMVALLLAACSDDDTDGNGSLTATEEEGGTMQLTSSAFTESQSIPRQFTCQGDDRSPDLAWTGAPAGVQSYALIMDDPDAPGRTWVHWVVYDLPADLTGLSEGVGPDVGTQGTNSWSRTGYGGPCPPSGTHRYFFKLYALDTTLDLDAGASKNEVLDSMSGHILAEAQLMGTYKKS
jgi:Raf kinase inhibitor-like YbhB/YbcL family protein